MGGSGSESSTIRTAASKKITPDKIKKIDSIDNASPGIINEEFPLLSEANAGRSFESPKDTFRLTYIIFYLHGIGNILPWNFFITATQVQFSYRVLLTSFECPKKQNSEINLK